MGYNNEARDAYGPNVNRTIYRTVTTFTPSNVDNFPINDGVLIILMSRIIEFHASPFGNSPSFQAVGEIAEEHLLIDASVKIEGAKVIVAPLSPLQPNTLYLVSGFDISPHTTATDTEDMGPQSFTEWITTGAD